MKFKTTKKEINSNYEYRICTPYGGLQNLLSYLEPIAYTTRVEGWAADIYEVDNTAIITGYAPFGNLTPSCELMEKYDNAAIKLNHNYDLKWEEKKKQIDALILDFIKEVKNDGAIK